MGAVLFSLIALSAPAARAQAGAPFPELQLARPVKAAELTKLAAGRIAELARWYGRDEASFRKMLAEERSLRADPSGRLHHVCAGAYVSSAGAVTVTQAEYPPEQTFALHSRPGASKVIYLDFNGHTTSGTSWNKAYAGGADFVTPAFDRDGNPAVFNDQELACIQAIWKRVAEDFAPYEVDVTTEDPGLEALRRSVSSDSQFGIRVCIGGSSYDWLKQGAGGVAYLGSFNWASDTPCYVFPAQLGAGNEKYTAEAASHEIGHTLGLRHDGQTNGTEYYAGHGNWAPIMGVGYYKEVTQWSRGEYSQANNTEDDLQVMKLYGLQTRADEAGGDIASAVPLSADRVAAAGIIAEAGDADLYQFNAAAGQISLSVLPARPSANLDVRLALYDGSGALVAADDSAADFSAGLSLTLPAGTYYASVEGVGRGDPVTAYSDYGSLGEYALNGTVVPAVNQPPVAVAQASTLSGTAPVEVAFSAAASSDPEGDALTFDWDFGNGGTSTLVQPTAVFSQPGVYQVSLVVRDAGGLSAADALTVTVLEPQPALRVFVGALELTVAYNKRSRSYQARALVRLRDTQGRLVSGAVVQGAWSGLVTGAVAGTTNRKGEAVFTSPSFAGGGGLKFSVTGVTAALPYDPALNLETAEETVLP